VSARVCTPMARGHHVVRGARAGCHCPHGAHLALRCRAVITVDTSPGMSTEFTAAATEAGISNARFIHAKRLPCKGELHASWCPRGMRVLPWVVF